MSRLAVLALVAVAGLHVATAALPDIYDELPGQYAATAWEMVESGDWLIPTLGGVPRLQKPPLVYWLTAASLGLLGRGEFGARLPTALALVGLMLVTRALGARLYGPPRGTIAAVLLGTSFGMVALGKLIMPEPFLALGIAACLFAVVRLAEDRGQRQWWSVAAWGAAALAALSKGLHGLLLPVVIVSLLAAASPASRRPLRALLSPWGPALFLGLVLPWPLYVESQFPGYLADNLWNEQLGHVLDTHFPRDSEPTPLGILWAQHLVWWFPWLLFVGAAAASRAGAGGHPAAALPAVWFLTTAVAASLSGQRQDYHTIFAWPAFALLVSRAWAEGSARRGARLVLALPLVALLALGVLALIAYALSGPGLPVGSAASVPFGERNSVLTVLSGVAGADWRRLRPLLLPVAAGLLLGGGGGLLLIRRPETRRWSWAPIAAGMLALLLAATAGLQAFAPLYGLKPLALALARQEVRGGIVIFDGPSHRGSSLPFYTDRPVRWLDRAETEFAVRSRGVGSDRFIEEDEVVARWRAPDPLWLVTEESRLAHWRARLGADLGLPVSRSGTRVLLGNRAARAPSPLSSPPAGERGG